MPHNTFFNLPEEKRKLITSSALENSPVPIIKATIHAAMLGATIISKEERDKTGEFLFVKPVSRSKIITSKLLVALMNIVIVNIITWVLSFYLVGNFSEGKFVVVDITNTMIGMFILQILFLVIGSATAAISKNLNRPCHTLQE